MEQVFINSIRLLKLFCDIQIIADITAELRMNNHDNCFVIYTSQQISEDFGFT